MCAASSVGTRSRSHSVHDFWADSLCVMRPTSELRAINSLIDCVVLPVPEYVRRELEPVLSVIRAPVFLSRADFLGIVNRADQGQTRSKAKNATTAGLPERLLHFERAGAWGTRVAWRVELLA